MQPSAEVDLRGTSRAWVALVVASLGLFALRPAGGAEPLPPASGQIVQGPSRTSAPAPPIADVVLQPDGTLRGRILSPGNPTPAAVAQVPISFVRDYQVVARVQSDGVGQFAVRNFRGGTYQVVLDDSPLGNRQVCRIWSAAGAPPQASGELMLSREPVVVRGQSLFWAAWPPNATITALTAGAITGPIVYNNIHHDNRAPTTP